MKTLKALFLWSLLNFLINQLNFSLLVKKQTVGVVNIKIIMLF